MFFLRPKSCLVAERNPYSGVLHVDFLGFLRGVLSDPRGNVGLGQYHHPEKAITMAFSSKNLSDWLLDIHKGDIS
jgi:hypothetical protein